MLSSKSTENADIGAEGPQELEGEVEGAGGGGGGGEGRAPRAPGQAPHRPQVQGGPGEGQGTERCPQLDVTFARDLKYQGSYSCD